MTKKLLIDTPDECPYNINGECLLTLELKKYIICSTYEPIPDNCPLPDDNELNLSEIPNSSK